MVIFTITITTIVISSGAYLWQKNQTLRSKQEVKTPVVVIPTKKESDSISILNIAGLSFKLPPGWLLDTIITEQNKMSNRKIAKIKVPDPGYHVILPMRILISDHKIYQTDTFLKETPSGAKIYDNFCAPTIACYYLVYNGKTYDIAFEVVESNEQAPDNLDGIWFPGTTITENDTLNFLATVE